MTDNEQKNTGKGKTPVRVTVNEKWCKKCGICIAYCPKIVFTADEFGLPIVKNREACIKCMLCVVRCPEFAVEVKDEEPSRDEKPA